MPISDLDNGMRQTLFWMSKVKELTPFTPVVQRALATLDDSRSSASDLAGIIEKDEAMAAKILRLVNSAFYGVRGQVTTISRAVPLLGFEQLRMAILGVALFEQHRIHDPFAEENRRNLWAHATWCARWAAELATATQYSPIEEAGLTAMLHDVGKVVIGMEKPREFMISTKLSVAEGISSWAAEDRAVGVNHVEVGKMVADYWRFPPIVRCAVIHHHSAWPAPMDDAGLPDARKALLLQAIVRVANHATKESLSNRPPRSDAAEVSPTIGPEELAQRARQVDALLAVVTTPQ
jgi:HD-like signal output (HDOD) protein